MTALEIAKCQKMADAIADNITISPNLYKAFCDTAREIFVPIKAHAYELNPHPIAGNQWISSPLTVAKMTMALDCENCDNILEIGCGSGYQAAILSKLAHRIFSIERISALVKESKIRLERLNFTNIHIRHDDGTNGWKTYAPYDRILFSCACENISEKIFSQLKNGGILVAPIKSANTQKITKFSKNLDGKIQSEIVSQCEFVPLVSGRA